MKEKKLEIQYNECKICGANNGRAGNLFTAKEYYEACRNCRDSIKNKSFTLHSDLNRTDKEIQKMSKYLKALDERNKIKNR